MTPRQATLRTYRLLLRLLPAELRREYGDAMTALLCDRLAEARTRRARAVVWAYALVDLLSAAVAERLPRRGERRIAGVTHSRRRPMGAALDAWTRDVRYAVRVLLRARSFTVIAVLTLALGIGANSAIFSMLNGLLLRPLPYPNVDRLVWIATSGITAENLAEWREGMRSLERFAAFGSRSPVLTGHGAAERLSGMIVTEGFLPLLGAAPVRGRLWVEEEFTARGPKAVVVRQRLWNRIGVDELDVADAGVVLDGERFQVIGVLPDDFEDLHYESDVWFPAGAQSSRSYNIIGLRRRGIPIAAVRAEAAGVLERVHVPGARSDRRFTNVQAVRHIYTGEIRTPLLVLFAAAVFVLLIACANIANLLLSRATAREREMVVRSALGAGRGTLLRQLLTESAVLALAGAFVGWLVASAGLRAVLTIVPRFYGYGRIEGVRMDHAVLIFTILTAFGATLIAGLAPALHAARQAGLPAAGSTRTGATRGARRSRELLMAAEVALALVLLIGSLLLIRTFRTLRPTSPGFEAEDRMIASVRLPATPARDDVGRMEFARRLLGEVQAAAPAARAAIATDVPLSGSVMNFEVIEVDGRPLVASDRQRVDVDLVAATPNYFDVVGMRMTRGRGLAASDVRGSAAVVVMNESGARRFWGDEDPIGRRMVLDLGERSVEVTVAGIAADARGSGNHTNARATAFASFWQLPWDGFELVVHQPGTASLTANGVRRIVARIDPGAPVGDIVMMEENLARAVAEPRYHMILMTVFASLAVLLALVGCYGVLGYSVAQRTREIGVRVALGARRDVIVRSIVFRGALLVAAGLLAGTASALALTRLLANILYGVSPTDPATFAGAAAGLALVSLAAVYLPARRAAAVAPAEALRAE